MGATSLITGFRLENANPPLNGVRGLKVATIQRQTAQGGRFVRYQCVIGIGIVCIRKSSDVYYLPPSAWAIGTFACWFYSFMSLIFGFLSIQGIYMTPFVLVKNMVGGFNVTTTILRTISSRTSLSRSSGDMSMQTPTRNSVSHPPELDLAAKGKTDTLKAMHQEGRDLVRIHVNGVTCLQIASSRGNADTVDFLLSIGADASAKSHKGSSPLLEAAFEGHADIVHMLINAGANANDVNKAGVCALQLACIAGRPDCVQALVERGADVNYASRNGSTALLEAAFKGMADVCTLLLEHGADPSVANPKGLNSLHLAVRSGSVHTIQALVKGGVDPNHKDSNGWTPETLSRRDGRSAITKALVQAMASEAATESLLASHD